MDEKVYEQVTNVATLPGIVRASYAMPDAHWGYGFPIGGVAAFDPDLGGVVSAGGVGFDISCGVRALRTGLTVEDLQPVKEQLAESLFHRIPAGVGSTGKVHLDRHEMDAMLAGGASWAVGKGYGTHEDLEFIEEHGRMAGAKPECVSDYAKKRQQDEMGTLGSGNHYLEVQQVVQVFDAEAASIFGFRAGDLVVSIHCGSRGLGHQIGTEFLKRMVMIAARYNIDLPDRELACAPINSEVGQEYLGAMRAAINCALANRQIVTHLVRQVFADLLPQATLALLYDVSHNTCKVEEHVIDGTPDPSLRPSQGRDAGLRPRPSRYSPIAPSSGAASPDRWNDGNGLVCACGHRGEHVAGVRVRLSWSRSQHEPASSASAVAWSRCGEGVSLAWNSDSQPVHAGSRRGSARCLQGCQ